MRFKPRLICRAVVPCDTAPASYMGNGCGFPVERGDEYMFLLDSGEWTS